jgi:DNA-binding response OmpR family regulator
MSKTEDVILARLSVTPGEVVPVSEIERLIWCGSPKSNMVQVYVYRLRKRGHKIKAKKGVGYRLLVDES